MTRRDQLFKWAVYALGLLPVWVLDAFVLSRYPLFGVTPILLPVAAAAVAVLEGAAGGAVHQREHHHNGGEDGRPPGHHQPDTEGLQHPRADNALGTQHTQQKIAHHRRRQDKGQRQYHIEHTLDQTRELCDIVRRGDAREEHHHRRDGGNTQ